MNSPIVVSRLPYMDIAKGVLIIMLIICHTNYSFSTLTILSGNEWGGYRIVGRLLSMTFVNYFMPAFFIISGYCSSRYSMPLADLVKKNALTLLLPMVMISHMTIWFLCCMFFAKIICWCVYNSVGSQKLRLIIFLTLSMLSICIYNQIEDRIFGNAYEAHINHTIHAMTFALFFFVGDFWRQHESRCGYVLATILYIILFIICQNVFQNIPVIAANYDVPMKTLSIYHFMAISGSIMIIGIAKMIGHSRLLQFFGRYSLVIYLTHMFFLNMVVFRYMCSILKLFSTNTSLVLLGYFFIITSILILCSITARVLDTKYLRWIIGKF